MLTTKAWQLRVFYLALLIHLVAAITNIYYPVSLGLDVFDGFDTYHSFTNHQTPFHHTLKLNPTDISKNAAEFLAWFTPGCYILPLGLSKLVGVNTATAVVMLSFISFIVGVFGFRRLYAYFGFSHKVITLSLFAIAFQLYVIESYYNYATTDLYLFAILPWLFLSLLTRQQIFRWFHSPLLLLTMLGGFFLKNSFLLMALPLLIAIPTYYLIVGQEGNRMNQIKILLGNLCTYLFAFALCHYFFNRHGQHSGYARFLSIHLADIAVVLAGPVSALLSLDKLIDLAAQSHLHETRLTGPLVYFYVALATTTLVVIKVLLRKAKTSLHAGLWLTYTAGIIGLTLLLHITNSGIDTNSRIYFFSAFLLLPQLFDWILAAPRFFKTSGISLVILTLVLSVFLVFDKKQHIHATYPVGQVTGFAYEYLQNDRMLLPVLRKIDDASAGTRSVAILPTFGLALELNHLRSITYHERWNLKWWLEQEPEYHGTVDNFYIVSYKHLSAETLPLYLSKFTDYCGYEKVTETSSFNIFKLIPKK